MYQALPPASRQSLHVGEAMYEAVREHQGNIAVSW